MVLGSLGIIDIFASFADWLSIDMPYYAYEGDQVVVRCSGRDNNKIKRLTFYKDGAWLPTYYNTYIISNARPSDSGSYYCKAKRKVFLFIDDTEQTRSVCFPGGQCPI